MRGLGLVWLAVAASAAAAAEWQVDPGASGNRVQFTSEVSSFSFTGKTDRVDGFVYWEGDSLFERASQVRVEVDLNALSTGIGKRDRDMREVLDTGRFPQAVFVGTVLAPPALADSVTGALRLQVRGTMALHGVEHELIVPATIRPDNGGWRVETEFALQLADYQIEAPSLAAFIKVSQQVRITATFAMRQVPRQETGR
jgi:polyisoprenoid-binding protein YceI